MYIREAETAKAHIFAPKGRSQRDGTDDNFKFVAWIDQDYMVVGNHVDESTRQKIVLGQYVNFSKLVPKERILVEEDGRMELMVCNGKTYWLPVVDAVSINNFVRWEQAFRVFANIYTQQFPKKAGELIQYNHIIHSISSCYKWDNVYAYDKEFSLDIA